MANRTALIDAIVDDLQSLGLGEKTVHRYIEPRFTNVAVELPRLAVWGMQTAFSQTSTADAVLPALYDRHHLIAVEWFVLDLTVNERGNDDPTFYVALEETEQALCDRLGTYASGIPGFAPQIIGSLTLSHTERVAVNSTPMMRIHIEMSVGSESDTPFN